MKNKKRYSKSKPGAAIQSSHHQKAQKSAPVTLDTNNWDRYDEQKSEGPPLLDSRTDFAILAHAPITRGSHFHFRSEQNIKSDDQQQEHLKTAGVAPDLFKIDLDLLSMSISTVPFNERIGIDEKYFTPNQKQVMTRTASDNEEKYKSHLKNTGMDSAFPVVPFDKFNVKNVEEEEIVEAATDEDSVPDLRDAPELPASEPAKELQDQKDLEDWLDGVLDS